MLFTNKDIAQIFLNLADMLEIQGENKFKFLAYRRAGEALADLPRDLKAYASDGTLEDIPGVGKAIADKIRELLTTGRLEFYEKWQAEVPLSLLDIMRINGVGPKKARLFREAAGIITLAQLEAAARAGQLRDLPGMGAKSEQKILEGIAALARQTGRMPLGKARPAAEAVLDRLRALPRVQAAAIAGSIRRGRVTIGDVDLLVASDTPAPIMAEFVTMPGVARVLGHGDTKSSVELQIGLQMDLRVLPVSQWGTALQYFTGSKNHNVKLRQIALDKGYSLNESALSPVDASGTILEDAPKIYCDSEEQVYATLGLPWIPPELREDEGEIELARAGQLPQLITVGDIQGDLHMHTTWSDGMLSVKEMALQAKQRGRSYIVITDHSRSLGIAGGLSIERLLAQQAEVRQVNADLNGEIIVLHGTEMDIKADATLDYPDDILAQLDFVIASLHVSLNQPRDQITRRLLAAIHNPHVDLIGHPTARYLPEREAVDMDFEAVFTAAAQTGIALEINSNPRRLDLEGPYARRAIELGIPLAINTDAHNPGMMDDLPYGVLTARRGRVEARHVINTWPYEQFSAWVRARGT